MSIIKKEIRRIIRAKKKEIDSSKRDVLSESLLDILKNNPLYQISKNIFIFWSMDDEIDTRKFIVDNAHAKNFYLPAIVGENELELRLFKGMDDLKPGMEFNILEPVGKKLDDLALVDLAIIPGIAFDRERGRMGRGRGFYDRILKSLSNDCKKIGICYSLQIVDHVPMDEHDVYMDLIITDAEVI
ncbi:MAG: 5-formyltetrahydrofolate cyclo-ligase [Candidatus Delongbacteria bacterium]|nr:5-formyltetrahydrofolate cyclo-ligase [Candidatus Delongbacteria bacterium]MBN2833926.1 5-formyltetrahydrofolate cyclo-ligase [Candidatus Delongbacteria bacterium]